MRWVYLSRNARDEYAGFLEHKPDPQELRALLGGKGASLSTMTAAGVPVPPAFTITTDASIAYTRTGQFPEGMWEQTLEALKDVEAHTGKGFGDADDPLLLSVRSGARVSMPGLMDCILNIGLNEKTLERLAELSEDEWFPYDAYRRFITMFADAVIGLDRYMFEELLTETKEEENAKRDFEVSLDSMRELVDRYKELFRARTGREFPADPYEQLRLSIKAVFDSWNTPRAIAYRDYNDIPHDWGTGVNVQTMVFGNLGKNSGIGVVFSRDPTTGERHLYGEFLPNAQGEDVVAGTRIPHRISIEGCSEWAQGRGTSERNPSLEELMPEVYAQLLKIVDRLEDHYEDMQDVEFTIERGKLWILGSRSGDRTDRAHARIVLDLYHEGLISPLEAISRVELRHMSSLLRPQLDHTHVEQARSEGEVAHGLGASPGAGSGLLVFDSQKAVDWVGHGKPVILLLTEQSPDDVPGVQVSSGIVTTLGGPTSHAAVVSRALNTPAVIGCKNIQIDRAKQRCIWKELTINEGSEISIDGSTGEVFFRSIPQTEVEWRDSETLTELLTIIIDLIKDNQIPSSKLDLAAFALSIRLSGMGEPFELLDVLDLLRHLPQPSAALLKANPFVELLLFFGSLEACVQEMTSTSDAIQLEKAYEEATDILSKAGNLLAVLTDIQLKKLLEDTLQNLDLVLSECFRGLMPARSDQPLGPRILIVDDEPWHIQGVVEHLRREISAHTVIASSVDEAVRVLSTSCPLDMVISDIMLPAADSALDPSEAGLFVCKKVRDLRGTDIPIVCLTVVTDPKIWHRFQRIGVIHRINKPVLPSEVTKTVKTLLQGQRCPSPELLKQEIKKRRLELKSTDPSRRICALWALSQLSPYDERILAIIRRCTRSDSNKEVRGVAREIVNSIEDGRVQIKEHHSRKLDFPFAEFTEEGFMSAAPSVLFRQLRKALLDCGPFESNSSLSTVFAAPELRPWRHSIPQASSSAARVDALIDFLIGKHRAGNGTNALVLFLRATSDRHDKETECHHRLKEMAERLDRSLRGQRINGTNLTETPLDEALIAEIEGLVREDKLAEALKKLGEFETHRRTATLLASRLRRTQNRERRGTLTRDEADTKYTKIAQAILDLLSK